MTKREKIKVCTLLGSGHSLSETAQLISKKTGKRVSRWQVRYYLDSPKWAPHIRIARKDDVFHAEKLPTFSTTGRVRKYNYLLETFKILKLAASYMLRILREIRVEEYEALENKSAGAEGEVEDFFLSIEQRIIASRRWRDPDRELEKAAGLL